MSLSVVTIDCWDTILENNHDWDNGIKTNFLDVVKSFHSGCTWDQIEAAFSAEDLRYTATLQHTDVTIPAFDRIAFMLTSLGFTANRQLVSELNRRIEAEIFNPPPRLVKGAKVFCETLKASGLRIGLISNTGWFNGNAIASALQYHDLARFFATMVFSDTTSHAKPHESIFMEALSRLNASPCAAVHVGDNLKRDIGGAIGAGIRALHLRRSNIESSIGCDSFDSLDDILEAILKFRDDGAQ